MTEVVCFNNVFCCALSLTNGVSRTTSGCSWLQRFVWNRFRTGIVDKSIKLAVNNLFSYQPSDKIENKALQMLAWLVGGKPYVHIFEVIKLVVGSISVRKVSWSVGEARDFGAMSYLMSSFERRQVVSRNTPSVTGTVSSYDANSLIDEAFPDYNEQSAPFAENRPNPAIFNIDKCTDVRIGENVTQIYNSCMSHVKWKKIMFQEIIECPLIKLIVCR